MTQAKDLTRARPGYVVVVEGHRVGEGRRIGEIVEVLGAGDREHYRVRWSDSHESVFYPSSDATIRQPDKVAAAERKRR